MINRRSFLKVSGLAGAGLFLPSHLRLRRGFRLQGPGGSLDPTSVPKYQTPLLIPPVMPKAGTIIMRSGKSADYYEISMRQFSQQILPAGLPTTTVWGYGAVASASKRGLLLHNAPSLTIEAKWNRPVRVKWINELVDAGGNYRKGRFSAGVRRGSTCQTACATPAIRRAQDRSRPPTICA
jgi:hypothetical protein